MILIPDIMIGFKVHDKDELVFENVQQGHSWTRNFYNWLFTCATDAGCTGTTTFGAGHLNSRNMDGTIGVDIGYCGARSQTSNGGEVLGKGISNGDANADFGILVGTSDTAFSKDDYALGALIAHGTGTGQLSYVGQAVSTNTYTSGTKTWQAEFKRIFNNNSGSSITVKETGLASYIMAHAYSSPRYYLHERSVLDPTVAVANGAQLTVTYTISMDFSAID
jgi:hypothetical protein